MSECLCLSCLRVTHTLWQQLGDYSKEKQPLAVLAALQPLRYVEPNRERALARTLRCTADRQLAGRIACGPLLTPRIFTNSPEFWRRVG